MAPATPAEATPDRTSTDPEESIVVDPVDIATLPLPASLENVDRVAAESARIETDPVCMPTPDETVTEPAVLPIPPDTSTDPPLLYSVVAEPA